MKFKNVLVKMVDEKVFVVGDKKTVFRKIELEEDGPEILERAGGFEYVDMENDVSTIEYEKIEVDENDERIGPAPMEEDEEV